MAGITGLIKYIRYARLLLFAMLFVACNGKNEVLILKTKSFDQYSGGSASVYHAGRFYICGDDVPYLLTLNRNLDSTGILNYMKGRERIPKELKPDIESATWTDYKNDSILLLGSGSYDTLRNYCYTMNVISGEHSRYTLTRFYERFKAFGITELNIEAACLLPEGFLLAHRGNMQHPENMLFLVENEFWINQENASIKKIILPSDTIALFRGISGLDFSPATGTIYLSFSTEETRTAFDDGAIGDSFLAFATITDTDSLLISRFISLDGFSKKEKIESVSVVLEERLKTELMLVSDNDDGKTGVFLVEVSNTEY